MFNIMLAAMASLMTDGTPHSFDISVQCEAASQTSSMIDVASLMLLEEANVCISFLVMPSNFPLMDI